MEKHDTVPRHNVARNIT